MARPRDRVTRDAFTPTGSGRRFTDEYPQRKPPTHEARYKGRPPYMTTAAQRRKLRRKEADYGPP